MNIHAVIMAGGSGTRFWPFSTPQKPKQFLDLTGEGTMLALTLRRLEGLVPASRQWVLTNRRYTGLVAEQGPAVPADQIVGEPMVRDTAAAIALGAGLVLRKDPEAIMAVLPADHVIRDAAGFRQTLHKAALLAEQGLFVTIGIKPAYPAEIYGYLEAGEAMPGGAHRLRSFVEKPQRATAEGYLKSGRHFWNAGMFIWKASRLLEEMERHLPEHAAMARTLAEAAGRSGWDDLAAKAFFPLRKISVDYGIMEKVTGTAMLEASFDWNDVGGWLALEDLLQKDAGGNTVRGRCVMRDARQNIIIIEEGQGPVVASGVSDMVIIAGKAGTLVCPRSEVERIKSLVQELQEP